MVIYPNDHRPAHVHVIGKGHEAVFQLHAPEGPAELRENYGFGAGDLAIVGRELTQQLGLLAAAWRAIHGQY